MALNCDVDLRWFDHIVACGLVGRGVTSLTVESGCPIGHLEVMPAFIRAFQEVFHCEIDLERDAGAFADLGLTPPTSVI